MYKICFYVPQSHLEDVKNAMFSKGAGKVGHYDCCAWQILGEGQFQPLESSQPFIGEQGKIEKVAEYKVEMVCETNVLKPVIRALKKAHPYETPAFDVWPLTDITTIE